MGNFSLLVQKKYGNLSSEQKQIFNDEFERRKKSVGITYLLWLLGWHYAYLKKWGLLALFLFSLFGFFIWWIIDLFRIPKMVEDYNNELALEILRDITLMFGSNKSLNEEELAKSKSDVIPSYMPVKNSSGGDYSLIILLALLLVFVGVSAFTKPDRITMENKIADKMMENNPEMVKMLKNLFFGKEMKEEHVENFINNSLEKEGYTNVVLYEGDWVVMRKIEFRDGETNEKLINAYGILGKTFVKTNFKNKDFSENNNPTYYEGNNANTNVNNMRNSYITPKINQYQPINGGVDYSAKGNNSDRKKIVSEENEKSIEKQQNNLDGDSIKIN